MKEIDASAGNWRYEIYINNNFDSLNGYLEEHKINEKILIITDAKVAGFYGDELACRLKNRKVYLYSMPGGEKHKNLETVEAIYDKCMENDFNRSSAILSLGGGIVGDVSGFAASTYMRGIKFVQVPTTLIADVDSSIGGKVGVNYKNIKNIIGQFYHPDFIYINTSTLKTLERRQLISGFAEIIKYAVLFDVDFFGYLNQNVNGLLNLESDKLNYVIKKCISLKLDIIKNDIYDKRERRLLNFGHTVGHAVESVSDYSIFHGEAVAMGMMFECALSNVRGRLSTEDMKKVFSLIIRIGLGYPFDFSDIDSILNIMKHDKKADMGNIKFAVPDSIGHSTFIEDVSKEDLLGAIKILEDYWRRL